MLFNSYIFIFLFLPVTVAVFFALGGIGHHRVAISWLVAASLFFYGWWNPAFVTLILFSVLFNYGMGIVLAQAGMSHSRRRTLLIIGVATNLSLIGYFKYAGFFARNVEALTGVPIDVGDIVLPLAISFFTFQQIAYLADAARGLTREYSFLHYCLFVTFFPQLIAGPIVHHKEMMPQFARDAIYTLRLPYLATGLSVFFVGLFKKAVIADGVAVYATPVFVAADQGHAVTFLEAWGGALSYTFQLYFDFSGYSDMALGLGYMFGIRLPLNFHSPYRAASIIDFWRRWHMTLSRFLRDYLYIPLGGSRKGPGRRYVNLMVTMLLGGLWHGASWNFVLWGGLHGLYLAINHLWRAVVPRRTVRPGPLGRGLSWALTFAAVVVAWVLFRAETLDGAIMVYAGMAGLNGLVLPAQFEAQLGALAPVLKAAGWSFSGQELHYFFGYQEVLVLAGLVLAVVFLPNTYEAMIRGRRFESARAEPAVAPSLPLRWRLGRAWAVVVGAAAAWSLFGTVQEHEFLYFQF